MVSSARLPLSFLVAGLIGCGTSYKTSLFDDTQAASAGNDGLGPSLGGLGGNADACSGIQCQQVVCAGGGTTSVTGTVFDPSGTLPIYNALVYVPNAQVEPFAPGVACDRCATLPSGQPIATALTDSAGKFTLTNVPVGKDIPVVIQIGRWRRQIVVGSVPECQETPLDAALTRLPRNQSEGDIPKIAITTGFADSLECTFQKLGIDSAEFTNPDGDGRVHIYQGLRQMTGGGSANGSKIDNQTPPATDLWNDLGRMKQYDLIVYSCEGDPNDATKKPAAKANTRDYLNAGGRLFSSHYHYTWFENGASPLPDTAAWIRNPSPDRYRGLTTTDIDTSFPKGASFADWLVNVGASNPRGKLDIEQIRRNVASVPAKGIAPDASRRWVYHTNPNEGGAEETKFFSFNTPFGSAPETQCGRGVYTDIHVGGDDATGVSDVLIKNSCTSSTLLPQEEALLFLLFDLASCVQDDSKPPSAPPLR